MNQQIRAFEKQSGLEIYGLGLNRAQWEAKLEEFAKLIVQECVSQVAMVGVVNFDDNDHDSIGWAVERSIQRIQEHFGVKD